MLEGLDKQVLGIVEFRKVAKTLLEVLHEETLGIVEFHEVGKTLLEVLHEVSRNFLEILHRVLIIVVLYEVGILYLQEFTFCIRIACNGILCWII